MLCFFLNAVVLNPVAVIQLCVKACARVVRGWIGGDHSVPVKTRGQLCGVSSLLLLSWLGDQTQASLRDNSPTLKVVFVVVVVVKIFRFTILN